MLVGLKSQNGRVAVRVLISVDRALPLDPEQMTDLLQCGSRRLRATEQDDD
jgi:hypothetical protein